MLESLMIILIAIAGYIFFKSQGESMGVLSIKFHPYPNTREGRRRRIFGFVVSAIILGSITYLYLAQGKSPIGFLIIILGAIIVAILSLKR
jgi:uncharacterized membrane protein YccC